MIIQNSSLHRIALHLARTGLAIQFLSLLAGCATMVSTKEELQSLSPNEGIVIGSVLVRAEKVSASESGWAFLRGRQAEGMEYSVSISETGFNPIATTYSISAKPGKEEIFIKKLPAGTYEMQQLRPVGPLGTGTLYVTLSIRFNVKPQQTTYIGRLLVDLPDRIMAGTSVRVLVEDAQNETVEKARGEHPAIVSTVEKDLATRGATR